MGQKSHTGKRLEIYNAARCDGGKESMIKIVIKVQNGGVMVFDAGGEQIPEYQGQYEEVRETIMRDATPATVFFHWFDYADKPEAVSRAGW